MDETLTHLREVAVSSSNEDHVYVALPLQSAALLAAHVWTSAGPAQQPAALALVRALMEGRP